MRLRSSPKRTRRTLDADPEEEEDGEETEERPVADRPLRTRRSRADVVVKALRKKRLRVNTVSSSGSSTSESIEDPRAHRYQRLKELRDSHEEKSSILSKKKKMQLRSTTKGQDEGTTKETKELRNFGFDQKPNPPATICSLRKRMARCATEAPPDIVEPSASRKKNQVDHSIARDRIPRMRLPTAEVEAKTKKPSAPMLSPKRVSATRTTRICRSVSPPSPIPTRKHRRTADTAEVVDSEMKGNASTSSKRSLLKLLHKPHPEAISSEPEKKKKKIKTDYVLQQSEWQQLKREAQKKQSNVRKRLSADKALSKQAASVVDILPRKRERHQIDEVPVTKSLDRKTRHKGEKEKQELASTSSITPVMKLKTVASPDSSPVKRKTIPSSDARIPTKLEPVKGTKHSTRNIHTIKAEEIASEAVTTDMKPVPDQTGCKNVVIKKQQTVTAHSPTKADSPPKKKPTNTNPLKVETEAAEESFVLPAEDVHLPFPDTFHTKRSSDFGSMACGVHYMPNSNSSIDEMPHLERMEPQNVEENATGELEINIPSPGHTGKSDPTSTAISHLDSGIGGSTDCSQDSLGGQHETEPRIKSRRCLWGVCWKFFPDETSIYDHVLSVHLAKSKMCKWNGCNRVATSHSTMQWLELHLRGTHLRQAAPFECARKVISGCQRRFRCRSEASRHSCDHRQYVTHFNDTCNALQRMFPSPVNLSSNEQCRTGIRRTSDEETFAVVPRTMEDIHVKSNKEYKLQLVPSKSQPVSSEEPSTSENSRQSLDDSDLSNHGVPESREPASPTKATLTEANCPCYWGRCKKKFVDYDAVYDHTVANHITPLERHKDSKKIRCGWEGCGQSAQGITAKRVAWLVRHLHSRHLASARTLFCTSAGCSQRFRNEKDLNAHVKAAHVEDRVKEALEKLAKKKEEEERKRKEEEERNFWKSPYGKEHVSYHKGPEMMDCLDPFFSAYCGTHTARLEEAAKHGKVEVTYETLKFKPYSGAQWRKQACRPTPNVKRPSLCPEQ